MIDEKPVLVNLHARGGWWCVRDRPMGKGSAKKDGWYIRLNQDDPRIKEYIKERNIQLTKYIEELDKKDDH